MDNLQVFTKDEFGTIRTVQMNNEVYFVANDVAKALGYANPSKATNDHCKKAKSKSTCKLHFCKINKHGKKCHCKWEII